MLYSEKVRNAKGKGGMKKVEKIEKMGLTIGLRSGIVCKLLRETEPGTKTRATKVAESVKKVLDKVEKKW